MSAGEKSASTPLLIYERGRETVTILSEKERRGARVWEGGDRTRLAQSQYLSYSHDKEASPVNTCFMQRNNSVS